MKTLYIECAMGVAGDMLTASLLELFPNPQEMVDQLNALGIPSIKYVLEDSEKCGIHGSHMRVLVDGQEEDEHMHDHHHHDHDHEHHHHHDDEHYHHHDHEHEHDHHHSHSHSNLHGIEHIVMGHMDLPKRVKEDIMAVYQEIANAESQVHGMPVEEVHFHEVGSLDAIADVTAVCYLIHELGVDQVLASPIHVGSGTVKCAHGILPVPAPTTALILKDIPIYSKANIQGELCTPTGAALLKHFVKEFKEMSTMKVEKIGYGMGTKDFEVANCVRVFLGEDTNETDRILELSCNVDDMTAEEIGFATTKLFEVGARDVFTIAIGMKKNRPGTMIHVVCSEKDKDQILETLFRHTTTNGIRESIKNRYVLKREISTVSTKFGDIRIKKASGYGTSREKYEYDDLAKIAEEHDLSIREVLKEIEKDEK